MQALPNLGSVPLGSAPLGSVPLGSVPLGSAPLGSVPLGSVQLGSVQLGSVQAHGRQRSGEPGPGAANLKAAGAGDPGHPHRLGLLRIGNDPNGSDKFITTQNSPQSMRVWPGLRLIGAGGKIRKGVFVAVAEVEPDGVRLDNGMRLKNQELLRATRPSHAVTYASCQGSPSTTASAWTWSRATSRCATCTWAPQGRRAPSCWRRPNRTGSTAPPGAPA